MGDADWNIVISNRRRQLCNTWKQEQAAKSYEGPKVRIEGAEGAFECFAGTKLIGANNALAHLGLVNGAFLDVLAVGEDEIRLRDEATGDELTLTPAQVARNTKLRHALTIFAVQGRSLPGTIAVHDAGSRYFDSRHLYVALSRATSGSLVSVQ